MLKENPSCRPLGNCILLTSGTDHGDIRSRNAIRARATCLYLGSDFPGNDHSHVQQLMGNGSAFSIGEFYSRRAGISSWYYQMYSIAQTVDGATNNIAAIIAGTEILGDVIVVKNGPLGGDWINQPEIDINDVVTTLWWYRASGRAVKEVFAEREAERILGDFSQQLVLETLQK